MKPPYTPFRIPLRHLFPAGFLLLLSGIVLAGSPEQWRFRTAGDFKPGEFQAVSLGEDGALRLSPHLEELYAAGDPYLWSLALDPRGVLYAGSGNEGKIFRIAPGEEGSVLFDSPELEVHALAVSAGGRLYAGTSPEGKVYRMDSRGEMEEFFDPAQKYIWDLAFLKDGDLLVATGPEGILYRVDPEGNGEVWFDSQDTHIRALAVSSDGSVVVGTSGQGLILTLSPDGDPFVLRDSSYQEIVGIALAPDGTIFAAALGPEKTEKPRLAPEGYREPQKKRPPGSPQPKPQPRKGKGVVYRIQPDGITTELWSSSKESVFSLLWTEGDKVLLGMGDPGRVVSLSRDGKESEVIRTGSAQVTAMLTSTEGRLYLATSNLGSVSRLDPGKAGEGEYLSVVKDTKTISDWGNLSWRGEIPRGTAVGIMTRTGNTGHPDRTWSDWSEPVPEPSGTRIDRPKARYIQWKAVLSTNRAERTPVIREVSLAYLQRNLSPRVASVQVLPAGTRYQKVPTPQTTSPVPPQQTNPQQPSRRTSGNSKPIPSSTQISRGVRKSFEKGTRTVTWVASDPNGDSLVFSVYFRGEGEKLWKLLEDDVAEKFLSWDATAMPDGVYRIRIIGEDHPSNPPGEALEGERESDPFTVDHTPPSIVELKARVQSGGAEVTFLARDSFSPVGLAHYSVDANRWQAIYPEDRVADSTTESFRFEVGDLVPGEHTVVVRAADEMGNQGSGKIILEIP